MLNVFNIDDILFLFNDLQYRYKKALKQADEYLDKARAMQRYDDAIRWERKADAYYRLAMRLSRNADDLKLYV